MATGTQPPPPGTAGRKSTDDDADHRIHAGRTGMTGVVAGQSQPSAARWSSAVNPLGASAAKAARISSTNACAANSGCACK